MGGYFLAFTVGICVAYARTLALTLRTPASRCPIFLPMDFLPTSITFSMIYLFWIYCNRLFLFVGRIVRFQKFSRSLGEYTKLIGFFPHQAPIPGYGVSMNAEAAPSGSRYKKRKGESNGFPPPEISSAVGSGWRTVIRPYLRGRCPPHAPC